jgi:hypothetical protein
VSTIDPDPGPGPKPTGPTHPTPTGPTRGNGHTLPSIPGPCGAVNTARGRVPAAAGTGFHSLAQLVADARVAAALLLSVLQRPVDWAAVEPGGAEDITAGELQLMCARADVKSALYALTALSNLDHPVRFAPGYRPAPGHAITGALPVSRESDDLPPRVAAGASSGPIASGVRAAVPGLYPGSVSEGAHQAPCKAHRTGGDGVGLAQGVAPMGASFSLPQPPRWSW